MSVLDDLLSRLAAHKDAAGALALDERCLGDTDAAALLDLLGNLSKTPFTLAGAQLPASVTGSAFTVSGHSDGVALDLVFTDAGGEVAIDAHFHAPQIAPLVAAFGKLPTGFFDAIAAGTVDVRGLGTLTLATPEYGIAGRVTPASGFVTTSIAPRVDGQSPHGPLTVEAQTATSGYRVASPPGSTWSLDDLGALMPPVSIVAALGAAFGAKTVRLKAFALTLDAGAPALSSFWLDVAGGDPAVPLWSALDGKIELDDVIVSLELAYDGRTISLSDPPRGSINGRFEIAQDTEIDVQIPFPPTGIWAVTAFPDVRLPGFDDILTLAGVDTSKHPALLPAGLADTAAKSGLHFTYLHVAVDASSFKLVDLTVGLGTDEKWTLIPDAIELESLQIRLTIDGTPDVCGSVIGTMKLEGSPILVRFGRPTPLAPWRLEVASPAIALPSVGALKSLARGEDLGSKVKAGGLDALQVVITDLDVGIELPPPTISNLGLTLRLADGNDPLAPALHWELIKDVLLLSELAVGFRLAWAAGKLADAEVLGTFVLNGLEFDLRFKQQGGVDALVAAYSARGAAGTVDLAALIAALTPKTVPDLPALDINLADALLAYLPTDKPKYAFAMDVAAELVVSDLPLVGPMLPADTKLGLKDLKAIYASAALSAGDIAIVNGMVGHAVLPDAVEDGFSMLAQLELGPLVVQIGGPPGPPAGASPPVLPPAGGTPPKPPAPSPPTAPGLWKDVGKTLGPIALRRVGVAWADGRAWLLADAGLAAGGLTIDLQGLGIGFELTELSVPLPALHGLAVGLEAGPVTIAGGLVHTDDDYVGELLVEIEELQIVALGAWSTVDGDPSLFVFAMINNPPLGGPGFFFVTGLALGFGYNRSLELPTLDALPQFPFVAAAMGGTGPANPFESTDPTKALEVLTRKPSVVPPTPGEDWLAFGVRFTSFELLQSFALVTVEFGRTFEVALLGLSTLAIPAQVEDPLAFAELALEASFSSETGLVAIAAQLTPESYVMSRACKLTGGFAFYMWTKDPPAGVKDQPRAGEFVVTLGGYHPRFVPPKGYPVVPRIGATWQVDPALVVKGGLYFAVTPTCLMAGGSLEATWNSSAIQATFAAEADFLLGWKPFHYTADASVSLTARVQIEVICTFTLTIHIGAWVSLWGPPFAGTAHVDLDVVSFTISFGLPPQHKPTGWVDFKRSFLPADQESWCGTRVLGGLEKDLTKTGKPEVDWVVNGEQLVLQTFSVVPCTSVTVDSHSDTGERDVPTPLENPPAPFGVGPLGLADGDVTSTHDVVITHFSGDGNPDTSYKPADRLIKTAAIADQPRALWSKDAAIEPTIEGVNQNPATLRNMVTGARLAATAAAPATTTPAAVLVSTLQDEASDGASCAWAAAPAACATPHGAFAATVNVDAAVAQRTAIVAILTAAGADLPATTDLQRLARDAAGVMEGEPVPAVVGS